LYERIVFRRAMERVLGRGLIRDSAWTIANNGFRIDQIVDHDLTAMLWPHRRIIRGVATPAF